MGLRSNIMKTEGWYNGVFIPSTPLQPKFACKSFYTKFCGEIKGMNDLLVVVSTPPSVHYEQA